MRLSCYRSRVFARATTALRRQLTLFDHRIRALPVLVLMPHSRCNCRCVMCDIWKANADKKELRVEDLTPHLDDLRGLDLRWVVLSGGEALMHANLFALCRALREALGGPSLRITLLSTGLLLTRHAEDVVTHLDEVIVSLDGPEAIHDAIRNIPRAYRKLAEGVADLRAARDGYPISARCVVQRGNFRHLDRTIDAAQGELQLDRLSFLAADVSSTAFNRPEGWTDARTAGVALASAEAAELSERVEHLIETHADAFDSGFIAESPDRMRAIAQSFRAVAGDDDFPPPRCNAPWTSAVIETDGEVRPCFFQPAYGNLRDTRFERLVNQPSAIAWRKGLDMTRDATCRRCVCTLHIAPWKSPHGTTRAPNGNP